MVKIKIDKMMLVWSTYYVVLVCGGRGLLDTIMPTFRGGGGKRYPKMYYVVCERSLMNNVGGYRFDTWWSGYQRLGLWSNKIACFKVKLNWTRGSFFVFPPQG